ncbi:hypothetical protein JMJ35_005975 [Cladonia borealis]|uniref:CID domain-containing protein n=1 Tax=Cladonia borealis TaxID=184061 RepID=A0AA39QY57_9LECA|nr:hypothetical protein JMJ35_005975 [Cladonia borealis]
MADPFEVRMRFTSQLQHLNASVNSSQKAAHYALKYKDMDEDLHSCILEQLERNSMNNRANIMYFIEHLCEVAQREGHLDFVRMMQRDILRVVDAVAPSDGSGAANVKVVRRVLAGLQQKSILLPATVLEIEAGLAERDILTSHHSALSPISPNPTRPDYKANGTRDKRSIEQRIEEDRERHKKQREDIWAVEHEKEFDKLWREAGDVGEDEWVAAEEDAEERGVAGEI